MGKGEWKDQLTPNGMMHLSNWGGDPLARGLKPVSRHPRPGTSLLNPRAVPVRNRSYLQLACLFVGLSDLYLYRMHV